MPPSPRRKYEYLEAEEKNHVLQGGMAPFLIQMDPIVVPQVPTQRSCA